MNAKKEETSKISLLGGSCEKKAELENTKKSKAKSGAYDYPMDSAGGKN